MVLLEIHRAAQSTPAAAMETTFNPSTRGGYSESDFGATSVQEFTICDERAALLDSAIVSAKPFRLLRKLRSKSCFSLSLSRQMRM